MLKNRIYLISLLILLLVSISAIQEEMVQKLHTVNTTEERIEILGEYVLKTDDIDLLRNIQDYWSDIDNNSYVDYFTNLYEQNKDSEIYHYLWARVLKDDFEQQDEARIIIEKHPDFYYGYLLLTYLYNNYLFISEVKDEEKAAKLTELLSEDRPYLYRWLIMFPDDENTLYTMFYMSLWEKDYEQAEQYLLRAYDSYWVDFRVIIDFSERTGLLTAFETLFPKIISTNIERGAIAKEDSLSLYSGYYVYLLRANDEWKKLENYLKKHPQIKKEPYTKRALISLNIEKKSHKKAVAILDEMLEKDYVNYRTILDESEWQVLSKTKQWQNLLEKAKAIWDAGSEERKASIIADQIDIVAHKWELTDFNNNVVKLEEYLGSVIILNFWSIWSSPSVNIQRKLNDWASNDLPDNVKIFAINIFEQEIDEAKKLMDDDRIIHLKGDFELANHYRLRTVPHLIAIDKEGIIRYQRNEDSYYLDEILDWWVESLK